MRITPDQNSQTDIDLIERKGMMMNRATEQRLTPVMPIVGAVVALEIIVFLSAALLHLGMRIPLGAATLAEPNIGAAGIVEGISGFFFLIAGYGLFTRRPWARPASIAAQVFALAGVLVGIFALALNFGPRSDTNDVYHRIMLLLIIAGLTMLLAPEGKALQITHMLVRVSGTVQLLLGLIFWVSNDDAVIPTHILIGTVFVLSLWTLAFLAARSGTSPAVVAAAFALGLIIPVIGIAQVNILNGPSHWVIQVVHLLFGVSGVGIGELLGRRGG
jgi:hypothetical protein